MRAPESLEQLRAELSTMTPRARRQILARLSVAEREILELQSPLAGASEDVAPDPAGLSPWLTRAIENAVADRSAPMTQATRKALLESADAVRRPMLAAARAPMKEQGRSLLEAFGGLMPARRGR